MSPEKKENISIKPSQIDASTHLFGAFDNRETEVSAGYIIRMMQVKNSWESFTMEEIEEFYRKSSHFEGFTFAALIEPVTKRLFDGRLHTVGGGWIIKTPDGKFKVTEGFIERAFSSSPKN